MDKNAANFKPLGWIFQARVDHAYLYLATYLLWVHANFQKVLGVIDDVVINHL